MDSFLKYLAHTNYIQAQLLSAIRNWRGVGLKNEAAILD